MNTSVSNITIGILLSSISGILLTFVLFIPRLIQVEINPLQISFLRYVGGSIVLSLGSLIIKGQDQKKLIFSKIPSQSLMLHIFRALAGIGTLSFTICAALYLPIGNVQAILSINGAIVLLMLAVLDNERLSISMSCSAFLCIFGAILCSNPCSQKITAFSILGSIFSFTAAFCWALEIYLFRHVAKYGNTTKALFAVNIFCLFILIVPAILVWHAITIRSILIMMIMGPLAVISQILNLAALRKAPLSYIVPFRYLNIPFSILIGFLVLKQRINFVSLTGVSLILIGGIINSIYLARFRMPTKSNITK